MTIYEWNSEKNELLKQDRGIGFEEVISAIDEDRILTIIKNPYRKNQKMYIFEYKGYAYAVPFVETKGKRFLKTIFPSRKYTKLYLEL